MSRIKNKINNWLYLMWYAKQLKKIKKLQYVLALEAEKLKSNALLEIQNEIETHWLSIHKLEYKLGIKNVENLRTRIQRNNVNDLSVLQPNPVFTADQIAEVKNKYWVYLFVIIFFCLAESGLYYLTASLFVPGLGKILQFIVAAFLAVVIMFGLNYAFEQHFQFRDVTVKHSKGQITDLQLKEYKDKGILGYVILVISFVVIIVSGFVRIFFMDHVSTKGLSPAEAISKAHASQFASIFTMFVTILAAIIMAVKKHEQAKLGIRYRVYRAWHSANVKRNTYSQELIRNAVSIENEANKIIQKYIQLIINTISILKLDQEYDAKHHELYQEYIRLAAQEGFTINDDVYRKFKRIQCAEYDLFKYGILNSPEIKDKIIAANQLKQIPKEHIVEHLLILHEAREHKKLEHQNFSLNGSSKNQDLIIN